VTGQQQQQPNCSTLQLNYSSGATEIAVQNALAKLASYTQEKRIEYFIELHKNKQKHFNGMLCNIMIIQCENMFK